MSPAHIDVSKRPRGFQGVRDGYALVIVSRLSASIPLECGGGERAETTREKCRIPVRPADQARRLKVIPEIIFLLGNIYF
jgi:hypothetical protein